MMQSGSTLAAAFTRPGWRAPDASIEPTAEDFDGESLTNLKARYNVTNVEIARVCGLTVSRHSKTGCARARSVEAWLAHERPIPARHVRSLLKYFGVRHDTKS